jgi:hypothetical protein
MRTYQLVLALCVDLSVGGAALAASVPSGLKGCWIVAQELKTRNISGVSQSASDELLGRKICFSESTVTSGSAVMEHARYREVELSDAEFFRDFVFVPLKALGIRASRVTWVDVDGTTGDGVFVGDTILVAGKRRIILYEGVFFELARAPSDCSPDGTAPSEK